MPKDKLFYAPNIELEPLVADLEGWLRSRGFDTQSLPVEGGGVLLQARQESGWRTVLGMSLANNIVLTHAGPNIKVETGQARWLDKAVVGVVGLAFLWPFLIPAAIGTWQQSRLPEEIFDRVAAYISRNAQSVAADATARRVEPPPESAAACANCGHLVGADAKFCENCGTPLRQETAEAEPDYCQECGAELASSTKFCPECGTPAHTEE